jgi:hypothetical protein
MYTLQQLRQNVLNGITWYNILDVYYYDTKNLNDINASDINP